MIREDRVLLAELARLNRDMASLALRIMDGSASAAEQQSYAQRLIAAGKQLKRRTIGMRGVVIEGQAFAAGMIALPGYEQLTACHTGEEDPDPEGPRPGRPSVERPPHRLPTAGRPPGPARREVHYGRSTTTTRLQPCCATLRRPPQAGKETTVTTAPTHGMRLPSVPAAAWQTATV